jgi:Flp pilus assembly protein TadG
MIEMAIVFALFVLLVWGVISFGVAYQLRENMTHSAQEALRAAVVASGDSAKDTAAIAAARSTLSANLGTRSHAPASPDPVCSREAAGDGFLDVCTDYSPTTGFPTCNDPIGGECMTVTVKYHWASSPLVAPILGISDFIPSTMTVTATGRVG